MVILLMGLGLFLGVHSTRVFAENSRTNFIKKHGEGIYKSLYTLFSLAGFGLIIWGYSLIRVSAPELWWPALWLRHIAALLMAFSMIFLVSAYIPGNRIKAVVGHPMLIGVKIWSIAHLISNARLADMVLFGTFLIWAVLAFRAARRRDRLANVHYPVKGWTVDTLTVLLGLSLWGIFAFYLHAWLIGVRPF